MNSPQAWALGLPAMGGIGTARALAQFYAMLASGGQWRGRTLVSASILQQLQKTLSQGEDLVLCTEMAFSAGMMKDPCDDAGRKVRQTLGASTQAFGHAGAGGSLAFADAEHGLGFAYVMNQMELGVLPNEKALSLVQALEG
jgi:CubicO group peptidase (beta-lactamase class C family)